MRGWLRRELGFLVVALGIAALVVTLAAIPVAGTASAPVAAGRPLGVQSAPFVPTPNGTGSYAGGSDANSTYQLPLVRTDAPTSSPNFDTIIHVANATASGTTPTVKFYDQTGTQHGATVTYPGPGGVLPTWASWDIDTANTPSVGFGFKGSAVVSGSGITVAADIISNSNGASGNITDNLDSYQAITGGLNAGFIPLTISNYGYQSTLFIRNTSPSSSATVTVTFWSDGCQVGGTPTTLPPIQPNGSTTFNAPSGYIGPVQITSTGGSVSVMSEVSGIGGSYGVVPMIAASTSNTFYLPRFTYNSDSTAWNDTIVVLNTSIPGGSDCHNSSSVQSTYTVTFYNPDGSTFGSVSSTSLPPPTSNPQPPIGSIRTWLVGIVGSPTKGNLQNNTNPGAPPPNGAGLPSGWTGSAVVTVAPGSPPAAAMDIRTQFSTSGSFNLTSLAAHPLASAPLPGQSAYVPSVRNGSTGGAPAGTETTGFSLMNSQTASQDYAITYWDQLGNFVRTDKLSLKPNQAWYIDQQSPPYGGLSSPFSGSVQITNFTSPGVGPLPIVDAYVYAGSYVPPTPSSASMPTPIPTNTPLPTPAGNVKVYLPDVSNGPND